MASPLLHIRLWRIFHYHFGAAEPSLGAPRRHHLQFIPLHPTAHKITVTLTRWAPENALYPDSAFISTSKACNVFRVVI